MYFSKTKKWDQSFGDLESFITQFTLLKTFFTFMSIGEGVFLI